MAHTIPFDTHAFVKKLTAAGMPEPQAEVQAQAIADLVNDQLATKRDIEELRLATKRDIEELRVELKRDIEELRVELKRDIESLKVELEARIRETSLQLRHDLTLRMGIMLAAGITIVAALVGFF